MARKGLPRKYAKLGFAKGWKKYKASKKSKSKTYSKPTKTKRVKTMARKRRSYSRRRSGKKKTVTIPVGGIAIGLATAGQLGMIDAGKSAIEGDFQGALDKMSQNSVTDVITANIPPLVYGVFKKAAGPVTLFQVGKFKFQI